MQSLASRSSVSSFLRALAVAGAVSFVLVGAAEAKNSILTTWRSIYPNSLSDDNAAGAGAACYLCHASLSDWRWNAYGWRIRELKQQGQSITQAILLAGQENSDNDPTGALSDTECLSDTQPGYTAGPNNTFYFKDGSTLTNQNPPAGILGLLDPPLCGNAATAVPYGTGKPGSFGVPTLTSTQPPALGATADLTLANALPGATAVLFFGLVQTQLPFDGGFLYVQPLTTLSLPIGPSGGFVLPVQLPSDPSLCGFPVYFQVLYVDPGAGGFNHTAQTNGLAWTLGS